MAKQTIYTRVYSNGSAGRLTSGKGPKGDPLTDLELLDEFRNHADKEGGPTALVSVSSRIIDTVKRSFEKHENGESPADIWIAFIEVPDATPGVPTPAEYLAEKCGLREPRKFCYEFVFEWAIPEKYVLHEVSLQTLIDRGLDLGKYVIEYGRQLQFLSTMELRRSIARCLEPDVWNGPWEIGLHLGLFARKFGARAPLNWIAYQLLYDCVDVVRLYYKDGPKTVDFDFFCELESGIDTALIDWWLADIDFFVEYEAFKEWRDALEDGMVWDMSEMVSQTSKEEELLRETAWNEMLDKHEKTREDIEARAVIIGL